MKKTVTLLLCGLLLTGCAQSAPAPTEAPTAPPTTQAPTEAPTEAPLQSFTVCFGDENAENFLSEEVRVPEINETVVTECLVAAGVLTEDCAVNALQLEGDHLIVDFNRAFGDLVSSMGTSGERIVVGSTVNTFLNAYGAQTLSFTVDGEILESGHVVYDFPLEFTE